MPSFVILNLAAPTETASLAALDFAKTVLAHKDKIEQIFFYGDGVLTASCLMLPPQDEINLHDAWRKLSVTHQIPLYVCSASALRRGIVDEFTAKNNDLETFNLKAPFELAGLGKLAVAIGQVDHVMTFGDPS